MVTIKCFPHNLCFRQSMLSCTCSFSLYDTTLPKDNQKLLSEGQTIQWPDEKGQRDKQCYKQNYTITQKNKTFDINIL
jgi:hypothetical protein